MHRNASVGYVGVHTRSHCTQAFYVRVIKHFACEGIIVGVGPCAVYTMPVRRGVARDGEGVCSLGLGAPGGYRAPFFILWLFIALFPALSLSLSLARSLAVLYIPLDLTSGEKVV